MMTTQDSRCRFLQHACICAALLGLVQSAPCADVPESAPESAPVSALAKLHNFTDHASELAMRAMGMLGIRYKYGGSTPETGLDCSGLVRYVFKEVWGADLPRTAEQISRLGQRVETGDLQAGDLVFYKTLRHRFSHVGIYLGDNKFIHSPSRGGEVRIESMDMLYWKKRFNGARRINDPANSDVPDNGGQAASS